MEVTLSGDLTYKELHQIADDLSDMIADMPDAKEPLLYGYRDKEYWVEVSAKLMDQFHISINSVIDAINRKNVNLPGGTIKNPKDEYSLRTVAEFDSVDDIDDTIIRTNDAGVSIKVRQVGKSKVAYEDESLIFRSGSEDSIHLIVRKIFEWPNIIEVASKRYEPHRLTFYLYELSTLFHTYWSKGNEDDKFKIIKNNNSYESSSIIILQLLATVINNGINILGVSLPDKM